MSANCSVIESVEHLKKKDITRRCADTDHVALCRFIDSEKWRKKFGTDDLPRTFDYKEKPEVFEYYPQYYHKTDKVRWLPFNSLLSPEKWTKRAHPGRTTHLH